MARDRQRAKQRQADRRAARLAARRAGAQPAADDRDPTTTARPSQPDPRDGDLDASAGALAGITGAPPENVGRSDTVSDSPPPAPIVDDEDDDPELEADAMEAGALGADEGQVYPDELEGADGAPAAPGPRGVRGSGAAGRAERRGGGKVLGFLAACWAELQRVQWPDRATLTQLTGIVLFFCVIAGVYLGVLDQIFSKLIQAIL
jgi:preprotein translocase SecE subunit